MQKTMKKTLSIILAILMIVTTIPIAFAADSDGVKTELDISKGKIVIADSYVTLNGENVEVDPDGYIITGGSVYQDTALKIINNSGEEKTLNIVFKDLYISSMDWATAFCIDGNSPLTLNILLEGSTYIAAHNHAAIEGSIPDTRVNFTTTEGSSLKLYDQFGGETSAFSYRFTVSIDGKEVGPDLHIHEYADGVQSCRGYLCSICDEYFGEKDESLHESNGVQGCRGYFCYICYSYYGERGPHKKDWQSCIGWFCNDCQEFNYPDEGDENKHNWIYGKCSYCNAKFPEDAECLHDCDMESQCRKCGLICEHQLVENDICSVCNSEMNFILTTGDTVTYHKIFRSALNQAENGSKITLINDYYYGDNYEVSIQKDIIIDINGHKWCPEPYLIMHILADVTITGSTGKGDFVPSLYIHSLCKLYDGHYSSVMLENSEIKLDDLLPQCRVFTEVEAYDSAYYENLVVAGEHSFTEYKEVKAPACEAEGLMVAECDNGCGETDEKAIEALNHKDTLVKVDAKAPTCAEIGWDAYEYCTACDYTTYVEIPAITHTDANCDYKCDYNCGYEYETLDFSDAKVLTTVDGVLYIDGVEAETNSSKSQSRIYGGKYILEGDIETSRYIWIFGDTYLDLNGYTWNLTDKYINVNAPLSVYDTSEAETGKITSGSSNLTININNVAAGFNFYGGTIENTSSSGRCVLDVSWADVNLYAGKIKSNSQAIHFVLGHEITLNIDDTVIESGDDYADVLVALGINNIAKGDIDVTDYKGDSLTAKVNVTSALGKITVFKGIKNTQEAEKYQIIDVVCSESFDLCWEKTEYDEATGEKSIYTANNAFTQQPSVDNNYTVDFNNPDASLQWYEVEENHIGKYTAEEFTPLFSYDFKAGDILKVSTDSELRHLVIEVGNEYIDLLENEKTATITFDADTTVDLFVAIVNADNPVEVNFTVFKEAKLDGETEKTLQKVECGKSYYCKATVGENVYLSDVVTVGHNIVSVDAKAPTCTEIGWDAYEYCTACDYSTYVELPAITHTDANCDYKCDYNCGYVYETLDFSDAKAITEENGKLYIDGAEAEIDGGYYLLNEGKYKLAENIFKTKYIWVGGEVTLDLNGYVWDLDECNIVVNAPFSVYDTSADKNGKITSSFFCTIDTNNENGVFSLYSGTIENNSVYEDRMAISALWASVNLYGGKVKGNGYAVSVGSDYTIDKTVVLGDVVLESGEGYAQIKLSLRSYVDVKKINIDVTDYTGESLETDVEAESTGKFDILKGVSSADEAEKYKLNIVTNYNNFHEKTEYDEATGDVNIYIAKNAFTQQPSAENCFTVDFNNPAATFQWYEVEEEIIGTYVAESFSNLFTYNFKAGDILKVSTDSDVDLAHLAIGNEYLTLTQTQKSKTIKFNADKTITVSTKMLDIEGIELEFSIIRETALDGETGKALKNPECKKSYCCKATVNGRVYNSDTVVGHEIIQVEEKAATCTETGWEAYGYCTECDYTTYKEIPASHEILQVGAKAATCTETGWEAYEYCTACTYTTYVELPENGHTPLEAVKENEVAPKCDVTGSYDLVVYCDDCGAELDRDTKTVDALKHSFTKYEVTEEAKCGVAGKEVAACDNGCGATDEKAIEALKHDIVIDEAVAPKCGETGLTQGEHCTRCDYKVEQEIVPALEHKDADGDYKCDNGCGHEFEKPAPEEPTPDTPDEPTDEVCDHLCHKGGILGFLWKIVQFFSKLFKINPTCECGAAHY